MAHIILRAPWATARDVTREFQLAARFIPVTRYDVARTEIIIVARVPDSPITTSIPPQFLALLQRIHRRTATFWCARILHFSTAPGRRTRPLHIDNPSGHLARSGAHLLFTLDRGELSLSEQTLLPSAGRGFCFPMGVLHLVPVRCIKDPQRRRSRTCRALRNTGEGTRDPLT